MTERFRFVPGPTACGLCGALDSPAWKIADGRLYDRLCVSCRNTVASNMEATPEGEAAGYEVDLIEARYQAWLNEGATTVRDAAEYVSARRRAFRAYATQWELARGRVKDKIDAALAANLAANLTPTPPEAP